MTDLSRNRRLLVLAICCMSLLIVGMDNTIVNVALPSLHADLHASLSDLQWTVDAYTLVLASLLVLAGSTADRLGRRRIFQTGLAVFTVGSLLCSVAPGLGWLVAFRMVQAVGGSMLNPVAMSIITNVFTDRRERAFAIGMWGSVVGISIGLGPVVGGLLIESVGWRGIFWVNVPIGVAAFVLAAMFVPESRAPRARRPDPLGQVLVVLTLAALTYAIIEAPRHGWTAVSTVALIVVAVVAAGSLVRYESRRDDPLIDPRFFRSVPFAGATVTAVSAFGGFAGFLFLNTLYLQDVRGDSALVAGLCTLPLAVGALIFAPLSGRLVGTHRPARAAVRGGAVHGGRRADAGAHAHVDVDLVAAGQLQRLRDRLRPGERTHHEQRGVGHAEQPGRCRRGRRVDQPAGRRHARRGRHRVGAELRARCHPDRARLRRCGRPRLVDHGRLRGRGAGAGAGDHGTMGAQHDGSCRLPVRGAGDGHDVRAAERAVWRTMRALVLDRFDRRREVVDELDMSFVRVKALRHVAARPTPMAELVTALGTDRPYTTIVVDDLERRGYVTRAPHPDDRRAKIVSATPAGRRAARRAASILERPPAAVRKLSDEDLAELHRLLDLLDDEG